MLEALRKGEDIAAARVVIDKALAGDAVAARFVVSLASPKPRGRTIHLDMPTGDDCNVVAAFNVKLRAMCQGEITPDEALTVSRFLDGRLKTLRAWELEEKLTSFDRSIPGDPDWAPDRMDEMAGDEIAEDDAAEDEMADDDAPAMAEAAVLAAAVRALARRAPAGDVEDGAAQPGLARLQSACISGAPAAMPDRRAILAGMDPALAAGLLRQLDAVRAARATAAAASDRGGAA